MSEETKPKEELHLYELFFNTEFSDEKMEEFFLQLHKIPPRSSLIIWLHSNGGSIHVGMMLKEKVDSKGLNVTFISHLFNASMGCIMPQIGDYTRLAYQNSVFTFHGAKFTHRGSQAMIDNLADFTSVTRDNVNLMIMERVGLTKKEFKKYDSEDFIQFGYQLLDVGEHGFVDGLILKEFSPGIYLIKTRDGNKVIDVGNHCRSDIKGLPIKDWEIQNESKFIYL